MLGNPKWFKRRKYTGWGLTPVTWQGWLYAGILIGSVFFVSLITTWLNIQMLYQFGIILAMLALIILETTDIAIKINKDERETAHEALAERNAAWVMVVMLIGSAIFQSTVSVFQGKFYVDPFIIAALIGGTVAKGISNWYYLDK